MELSDQIHAPASLIPVRIEYGARWPPEEAEIFEEDKMFLTL